MFLKKICSIIGIGLLICFSFYYTDSAVNIVKRNDPIMKEIIKVSNQYEVFAVDATLINNSIIPGINGTKLDIDASYSSMKRFGEFNSSLLKFSEVEPTISINNSYDKYIISGNKSKHEVALLFKINNTSYIEEILTILISNNVEATFFLDLDTIVSSPDILMLLSKGKQNIELLGKNGYKIAEVLLAIRTLRKFNKNNARFCYLEQENNDVLNICNRQKLYTVIPNIITDNYPYSDVKYNLSNGSIIKLDNNINTVRELRYIVRYIKQKGYHIKSLNDMLKE